MIDEAAHSGADFNVEHGLAIAEGVVEAHDGTIWVESMLGDGTTFYFILPVTSAAEVRP